MGSGPWSVDPCRRYGVSGDFNKFGQLRFERMGRSGQGRMSLVSFPTEGEGDKTLTGTTKRHTGVYAHRTINEAENP